MTRPAISGISPFFIVADVPATPRQPSRSIAICWVLKSHFEAQPLTTSVSGLSAAMGR
jgi:hypothetical protein